MKSIDKSNHPFNKEYASVFGPPDTNKVLDTAVRYDTGKLDWSLLPWDSVEEVLKVLEFGKKKYSAHNWKMGEGFKYSRVFNSTCRHLFSWIRGEDLDPESGLNHLAHAACNLLFVLHYIKHKEAYKNNDDRKV